MSLTKLKRHSRLPLYSDDDDDCDEYITKNFDGLYEVKLDVRVMDEFMQIFIGTYKNYEDALVSKTKALEKLRKDSDEKLRKKCDELRECVGPYEYKVE